MAFNVPLSEGTGSAQPSLDAKCEVIGWANPCKHMHEQKVKKLTNHMNLKIKKFNMYKTRLRNNNYNNIMKIQATCTSHRNQSMTYHAIICDYQRHII